MRNWGPQHLADAERLHVVDFCSRIAASEHVMETHFGASKLSGQACFSWRISGRTPLPLQVRESPSSGVTLDSGSGAGFLESWCRYHVETMLKLALALSSSQRGCWCGPLCTPCAVAANACAQLLRELGHSAWSFRCSALVCRVVVRPHSHPFVSQLPRCGGSPVVLYFRGRPACRRMLGSSGIPCSVPASWEVVAALKRCSSFCLALASFQGACSGDAPRLIPSASLCRGVSGCSSILSLGHRCCSFKAKPVFPCA